MRSDGGFGRSKDVFAALRFLKVARPLYPLFRRRGSASDRESCVVLVVPP
jgi:hypothetical protein